MKYRGVTQWSGSGVLALLSFVICVLRAEPVTVGADPEAGFHFPYVLSVPESTTKAAPVHLIVETNNTGPLDSFEESVEATLGAAAGRGLGPMLSRHTGRPLLMPVFPREKSAWQIYTHALDRDTMAIHQGPLKRLDLQLISMVEDARKRLTADGYTIPQKFVMVGFSASGSFANRFSFLWPERLAAVVAGGLNAFPMLPVEDLRGQSMEFPLGVRDLSDITGEPFNESAWKALPQMLFMGGLDDNDAVLYDDAYSESERAAIFATVGKPMHTRWLNCQEIYLEEKANVTLVTYSRVGHWTNRQIGLHITAFVEAALVGE